MSPKPTLNMEQSYTLSGTAYMGHGLNPLDFSMIKPGIYRGIFDKMIKAGKPRILRHNHSLALSHIQEGHRLLMPDADVQVRVVWYRLVKGAYWPELYWTPGMVEEFLPFNHVKMDKWMGVPGKWPLTPSLFDPMKK